MDTKYGFLLLDVSEFENWVKQQNIARTILNVQLHHTYLPSYKHFEKNDHFNLQLNMKNYHVGHNGWIDIGNHFTIFPDGIIATGRKMEISPACIHGNNQFSVCIECLGNFDNGFDNMTSEQSNAIIHAVSSLLSRFNISPDTAHILYHHWFDLTNGARTNGRGITKTCPGTNFFGGNSVKDCENNFLPLVKNVLKDILPDSSIPISILKYGMVTANKLNIRKGPGVSYDKTNTTTRGSVIRIYEEQNNWYKISLAKDEWVSAKYVDDLTRAMVRVNDTLNVRSGPSTSYPVVGTVYKNQDVFIRDEMDNWCQIGMGNRWVSKKFLKVLL